MTIKEFFKTASPKEIGIFLIGFRYKTENCAECRKNMGEDRCVYHSWECPYRILGEIDDDFKCCDADCIEKLFEKDCSIYLDSIMND